MKCVLVEEKKISERVLFKNTQCIARPAQMPQKVDLGTLKVSFGRPKRAVDEKCWGRSSSIMLQKESDELCCG
ncbi:hypothetical protein NPIL_230451 [Nephila pilipes]|uniref:Uncharacterized protein n=1 Tax=Nephila pilipes TaxID=299642 RepID=A0A8X6PKU7_NEPPI|nr:hypothetical protein NPIL_230451 [Nephila pilipes]